MPPTPFSLLGFVSWRKTVKEKTNWHNYAPWSECLSHTPSTLPCGQIASSLRSKSLFGRCLQSCELPGGRFAGRLGQSIMSVSEKLLKCDFKGHFRDPILWPSDFKTHLWGCQRLRKGIPKPQRRH